MSTEQELPRYQCHKQVRALKIAEVRQVPPRTATEVKMDSQWDLVPAEGGLSPVRVPFTWIMKHDPKPGGYYVVYDDGYGSYSPALAFESGYTLLSAGYRDRVHAEKAELDGSLQRLTMFLGTTTCADLPEAEKERLNRQAGLMLELSHVLGERIDAFPA